MQKYVIALYIRLSIEDYKYDSLSIENQSLMLFLRIHRKSDNHLRQLSRTLKDCL